MKKHLSLFAAAAMSIGGLTFVGCDDGYDDTEVDTTTPAPAVDDDNTVRDDLNRAGEDVERGLEQTGDAIDRGVDRTGDALEGAEERLENDPNRAATPTTRPVNQQPVTPPANNGL
jgi:hypothetical protein